MSPFAFIVSRKRRFLRAEPLVFASHYKYQESFNDEQEAFAEFTEKLAEVFTEEGIEKVDEAFKTNLLESMKENHSKAETTIELFGKVKEQLEEFV